MGIRAFMEIYGKKKPQQKLYMLVQAMERISDCRVHYLEAVRNQNQEEAAYYERDRKSHEERAQWLYSEIWNILENMERMENDWR